MLNRCLTKINALIFYFCFLRLINEKGNCIYLRLPHKSKLVTFLSALSKYSIGIKTNLSQTKNDSVFVFLQMMS